MKTVEQSYYIYSYLLPKRIIIFRKHIRAFLYYLIERMVSPIRRSALFTTLVACF